MTTWVITTWHPPQLCQTSNKVCGELFKDMKSGFDAGGELMPGFTVVAGPYITSDHRSFLIAEAEHYDAIRKFTVASRVIQWNAVETIPVITNAEAVAEVDEVDFIWNTHGSS